jgi:hypothetical protein
VETIAPPAIAYQRVAGVLQVLAELLQPVINNFIRAGIYMNFHFFV